MLTFFSCKTEANLEGKWLADGYNCNQEIVSNELIQIKQKGSKVIATKIIGDDCIPSGSETWRGIIDGNKIVGDMIGIHIQTLKLATHPVEIEIIDNNNLKIEPEPGVIITLRR